MSNRKILGLIPARGGSKGIPKKNLYPFNGKPLIQWTIEAAQESKQINEIIVSTDDEETADFAKKNKVEVPYLRSSKLAQDDSLVIETVLDTLNTFNEFNDILLQPTSPMRNANDINNIIALHEKNKHHSVVSIREVKENPTLFYEINDKNYLDKSFKKLKSNNRQSFNQFYILNGALYIASYDHLKKYKSFLSHLTMPYLMPYERSIDIDSLSDIRLGEFLAKYGK